MRTTNHLQRSKPRGNLKFLVLILMVVCSGWTNWVKAQTLVGAEYFFDTDPGFGNAIAVGITPATNIDNLNLNIDITGLNPGFHNFCFRVRDDSGSWSHTQTKHFYKETAILQTPDIVAVEYFIDNDPGFGNGTAVSVTPASILDNIIFTVDITSLAAGFHSLSTRVKDTNGKWSLVHKTTFIKGEEGQALPNIVRAEYFFDQDPGFGNGLDIPVSPDPTISNLDFVVDITTLSPGFHNLYCRVKDAYGKWSLTSSRPFYKEQALLSLPLITKVEYFLDNDPGFGNGTNVPIVPGVNKTINWVVNLADVPPGIHTLYTRVKDTLNRWSLTGARAFFKDHIPLQLTEIAKVEYFFDTDPGFGHGVDVPLIQDSSVIELNFTIDINTLSQGFHQLFIRAKDARGKWSLTQVRPFFKQVFHDTLPTLVKIEYFFDNDPGFGNGIDVPFAHAAQVPFLAWSLDLTNVEFGQHQLHIRTMDGYGKWSLTVRDTIFYYLDSLPTASLNGPPSICINGTGEFEVTLTGTPPWTLIYDTGEETDTVSGIMVNPYMFTVSPVTAGPHTAQVLKVQDTYYTGLYTGIPIEYEVHPLPMAAGTLYGTENICLGSGVAWYWIYGVPNATSYLWTVPEGASITSDPYSSSILVDFTHVTSSGAVTVTPVNYCGQGIPASLFVNIRPLPVADAGPDLFIPYGGSDTLMAIVTGGTEPYNFYWSPWYYVDNAYLQNPVAYPSATATFTLQVSDVYGCSSSDQVTVYVGVPEGTIVNGNFSYDNATASPLNNSLVMVKQGNTVIATDTTDDAGDFMIMGIPAGYYSLTGTSDKAWGGANATDALLVLQHYVEYLTLTGLRYGAADVTASYGINASDAFLIAKRYTGLTTSFPSGDWYSDTKYFTAAPVGTLTENLSALCFGDVDGSYIPGAKAANGVDILNEGFINTTAGKTTDIPLIATNDGEVGALSLTLNIPEGLQVLGVKPGKGAETGDLLFNIAQSLLKIAWYSLNPLTLTDNEAVLWITVAADHTNNQNWSSAEGSSVANGMGQTMETMTFRIPKLSCLTTNFELGDNYPDPFKDNTIINITLPEDGRVSMKVYNSTGQEVYTFYKQEWMSRGKHMLMFEARELPPGVYYYTVNYDNLTQSFTRTKKMVLQK